MTAAETSAKQSTNRAPSEVPKGCVVAVGPDGETPIIVRAPRPPGPHFKVKHSDYGSRRLPAATVEEAVLKFAQEFCPAQSGNKKWLEQFQMQCRVAKVPETEPAKA